MVPVRRLNATYAHMTPPRCLPARTSR